MGKLYQYTVEEQRRQNNIAYRKVQRYLDNPLLRKIIQDQNNLIFQFIKNEGLILEVGSGYGNFLKDALQRIQADRVIGMDISHENLKLGRDVMLNGFSNLFQGMIEDIPLKKDLFDVVIMRGVLHHLADPAYCLSNISKVIRGGGNLIIMEGDPEARYRRTILKLADLIGVEHEASQFKHLPSDTVIKILEDEYLLMFQQRISGLLTPFSFVPTRIGKVCVYIDWINQCFQKINPDIFGWWYLLVFQKKNDFCGVN